MTAGGAAGPAGETAGSRGPLLLLWLALGAACILHVTEIRSREIDPDEFEHLHAAYMVSRGDVPYRDFFEHHGPLLYYGLQPLFWGLGPELSVLWVARLVMLSCSLLTLALTARIASRLCGPPAGLVAATLLAWTTIFHAKGIELRPDVPAALLVVLAFWLSLGDPERSATWRRWLAIGLISGVATLFTQKSIVPIAGLALGGILREIHLGSAKRGGIVLLGMAAGGGLMWGAAVAAFGAADSGRAFIESAVVRLFVWPLHSRTWDQLRPTLIADLTLWAVALVETVITFREARQAETWHTGRGSLTIAALFSVVALAWSKATYPQFYLLWFPLLAALAARRITAWGRMPFRPWIVRGAALAGLMLMGVEVAFFLRAAQLGPGGALSHLAAGTNAWEKTILGFAAIACGLWFAWAIAAPGARSRAAIVGLVAALGMTHAVLRNADRALASNRLQVEIVRRLNEKVGPDEKVLDGFSGYGVLRPHAYYWWWINEYSLALMTPAQRGPELLERLQASPPAAVLFDADLARLPAEVTDWISSHYVFDERWPLGPLAFPRQTVVAHRDSGR